MPISVLCPSCSATVKAPDSAAGKRAKCPRCQEIMILPAAEEAEEPGFEVVEERAVTKRPRVDDDDDEHEEDEEPRPRRRRRDEVDAAPPKKSQSSRRVVAVDDDDDDEEERPRKKSRRTSDDDDDRPRKKGQTKKKSGTPLGLKIGGGVLVLLLVAGGVYLAMSGESSSQPTPAKVGEAPQVKAINWVPFTAPDGSFATAYPEGAPTAEDIESLARQSGNKNAKPEDIKMAMDMMKGLGVTMSGWSRSHEDRKYLVMVISVPPAMAQRMTPDALIKQGQQQSGDKILSQTDFSLGNLQGKEVLSREEQRGVWQLLRFASAAPGKIVVLMVETKAELKADDANAKVFFEKFQWKK